MSTSTNLTPDSGGVELRDRQRRWSGGVRVAAFAAAAVALVLIAAVLIMRSQDDANPTADGIARGFLEAYGDFDVDRAMTYLAEDATIASIGSDDDLRLLISWLEATGYQQILDSCEGDGGSAAGTVRCTFDFHGLRSDEFGRGPFAGSSFDLVVLDGEIVQASQQWEIEKFSPQVWEPFARWVSTAHPEDAAVMYQDESHSNVQLSQESIRLWERRTRDYVAVKTAER